MTKEIKIECPEGWEIDIEKSDLSQSKIVYKEIEKKSQLPKKWEELNVISGWYASTASMINRSQGTSTFLENKNIFPTRELAEASLALAQLLQLRDKYNDGWVGDWKVGNSQRKYSIYYINNEITLDYGYNSNRILCFKSEELRDKFLFNFSNLIEIAKPLI